MLSPQRSRKVQNTGAGLAPTLAFERTHIMMLGISLATFTVVHVLISLIAIASGFVVIFGLVGGKRLGLTGTFLTTAVLTSVTAFMFPFEKVTPGIKLGIISMVVLAITIAALYAFHLVGAWRSTYAVGATMALYLNCFVLIAQLFEKVPALHELAPTGSEPPFLVAQLVLLAGFIALGTFATKGFRHQAAGKVRSAAA
jgi:hypothetical protein